MNRSRTSVRRKIAAATWRPSRDGRIYARLEVDVSAAIDYARRVGADAGVQVSVTHVIGAALARVLRLVPEFRSRLLFGRVIPLEHCDIAFAVDIEGGSDLAPIKVRQADTLSPVEIAVALQEGAARLRAGRDDAYGRSSRVVSLAPAWAIRPVLAMSSVISGGLGRPAFGQPGFPLGTAFVSNVGTLGLDEAFLAPLPFARTPVYLAIGAMRERALVVAGEIVIRPTVVLVATADHRLGDGAHAGRMVDELKRLLADPTLMDEPERQGNATR
jgi:pyruvate/2-oxoglutarate dehydrogenase complex dihydrolipoamide acyltransferase (E2) component